MRNENDPFGLLDYDFFGIEPTPYGRKGAELMKPNEIQWKQLGFDKDPQPTGVPWVLILQIFQTILAVINYLAKRELSAPGKRELSRILAEAKSALNDAKTEMGKE